MTNAEFKKHLEVFGDKFFDDTCYKLQYEMIKKIVNCKSIPDFNKTTLIKQYTSNLTCNECIVESIRQYNQKTM